MTAKSNHSDEEFMGLAIAKAKEGIVDGQTPFGACIVRQGEVVACSHNEVWHTTDITAHAEIVAIRSACRQLKSIDLSECTIYSTCEPCPMCFAACHWAKLERIVFGASVKDAQSIGFNELTISNAHMKTQGNSPILIEGDFLREQARELFTMWQAKSNRRLY
jgi:guanine deaminase